MFYPHRASLITALVVVCSLQPNVGLTYAQGSLPAQQPAKAIEKPPAPKEEAPDYSHEPVVIQHYKTLYRYEKEGTGRREVSVRVKIQNDAGINQFGQLIFPYTSANEKLNIDLVRVLKPDGSFVSASANDVQDLSAPVAREAPIYTDLRQKHITVPGLRPGDVLEYQIGWQVETPVAPNHFWLAHNFVRQGLIVLSEELEVNIPSDSRVKLKAEPGLEPTVKEQDGRRIYAWKHANLKNEEKDPKEETKKEDDSEDPKPPQIQLTTFQSWDEVGRWYAGLERDRVVPDQKIRAKAAELVRGLSNDREKVEALYQYVAKNFRYVSLSLGQGRYQPHAAADVLSNQYGDCKDKHTLLASMLTAAGLRAYPALMNSSSKIDSDMPSPGQFDHVISAIPLGSETLWVDTTSEVAPFQLLAPPLRDKQALLIPASGPARLETTPADPPFPSTEVVELTGEVNDLGKLSGHARLTLRGDMEMLFRGVFRKTSRNDWKNLGFYLSMMAGVRGEVAEIKPSDPAATEKPFELEFDVTRENFLDWSGKKLKVEIPIPELRLAAAGADKDENSKPLKLGPSIKRTFRLKLTLPGKYQVRVPLPLKVSRDYAEYVSTYKLEGNTLIAERRFDLRQRELPAARQQDYRAFVAATRADEAQLLSLETSAAGSPSIPETAKVEELISAAAQAAKNENYFLVEGLLKRVLEKEPKHKSARRQLGWALYVQRKYDPAIEVLQEQTKINPYDDYSYTLLGRIFWQQQKYAEAETAFRKQIEVAPLDQWAHRYLGEMLVEWRKYKEAVPELEQAISLTPDAEFLYLSLGRAYLNLDQTEKAMEAFDKAVKLAPGPLVWNNVSYVLAVKNVQLERAQQYAESAVTAVATELRNLELEQLTVRDLQRVASIAAYWDTLGWVYFQKGNLDIAEKYIAAAWFLGQHSEVGYHLGQIYEKGGKRQEAIRMYAMASVANRLVPEARESLDRLSGKESEGLMKKAQDELREARSLRLDSILQDAKGITEAQFFVVLSPGSARNAKATEVKFIRGEEKLQPLGAALKGVNYNFDFPDEMSTKVIRRGTLSCPPNGHKCSFIMEHPEYVTLE